MDWIQKIKTKTDSITGYAWIILVALLVIYFMSKTKQANSRRSRTLKVVREPTLRDFDSK
jgi:hypothetical protein